jgi:hypothetical protein
MIRTKVLVRPQKQASRKTAIKKPKQVTKPTKVQAKAPPKARHTPAQARALRARLAWAKRMRSRVSIVRTDVVAGLVHSVTTSVNGLVYETTLSVVRVKNPSGHFDFYVLRSTSAVESAATTGLAPRVWGPYTTQAVASEVFQKECHALVPVAASVPYAEPVSAMHPQLSDVEHTWEYKMEPGNEHNEPAGWLRMSAPMVRQLEACYRDTTDERVCIGQYEFCIRTSDPSSLAKLQQTNLGTDRVREIRRVPLVPVVTGAVVPPAAAIPVAMPVPMPVVSPQPKPVTTYRGVKTYDELRTLGASAAIQLSGYTSSSTDPLATLEFLKGPDTTLMEIRGVVSDCAASVQALSEFPTEAEVVIQDGAFYTVEVNTTEIPQRIVTLLKGRRPTRYIRLALVGAAPVQPLPLATPPGAKDLAQSLSLSKLRIPNTKTAAAVKQGGGPYYAIYLYTLERFYKDFNRDLREADKRGTPVPTKWDVFRRLLSDGIRQCPL